MAISECPEISGATSGSTARRSVDRSTSMYARIGAATGPDRLERPATALLIEVHGPDLGQLRRQLRPPPPGLSVLALSAIVIQ